MWSAVCPPPFLSPPPPATDTARLTIVPSPREVLPVVAVVLQSRVAPPGNAVVVGQFAGPLGLVEQDGLHQHVVVVVLGTGRWGTDQ